MKPNENQPTPLISETSPAPVSLVTEEWDWDERVDEFHITCHGQTLFRAKDEWTAKTCVAAHNSSLRRLVQEKEKLKHERGTWAKVAVATERDLKQVRSDKEKLTERSVFAMSIMEDGEELWREAYEKCDKCPMLEAAFKLRSEKEKLEQALKEIAGITLVQDHGGYASATNMKRIALAALTK